MVSPDLSVADELEWEALPERIRELGRMYFSEYCESDYEEGYDAGFARGKKVGYNLGRAARDTDPQA